MEIKYKNNLLELKYKNSQILLLIEKEYWEKNELYNNLKIAFYSNIRLVSIHSQVNKNIKKTNKGIVTKLFYYCLEFLLDYHYIIKSSIIVVEADPSINNYLVSKYYIPLGFKIQCIETNKKNNFTLMSSTIKNLLDSR